MVVGPQSQTDEQAEREHAVFPSLARPERFFPGLELFCGMPPAGRDAVLPEQVEMNYHEPDEQAWQHEAMDREEPRQHQRVIGRHCDLIRRHAQQFLDIDLRSARESIAAAAGRPAIHFVYVSVAQPAPVMRAYQEARRQAEQALATSGLTRTIVRPWYVLGPGHRWPYALLPIYAVLERLPPTRDSARRLGLVTVRQMVATLVNAIEKPAFSALTLYRPGFTFGNR